MGKPEILGKRTSFQEELLYVHPVVHLCTRLHSRHHIFATALCKSTLARSRNNFGEVFAAVQMAAIVVCVFLARVTCPDVEKGSEYERESLRNGI